MNTVGTLGWILAQNLQALMKAHGAISTQAKLGLAAGVDQRTIGRILNCERAPTASQIEKIAKAFNIEPWQLLLPQLDPSDPPTHVLRRSQDEAWRGLRIAAETIGRYRI